MGDHLPVGKPSWYVMNHARQLSLLLSVGWEIRPGHNAVMVFGWGIKGGWLITNVKEYMSGR